MPAAYTGKLADPEFRRQRARKASAAAHTIDAYIRRIAARSSDLTPAQRAELARLVTSGPGDVRAA